MSNARERLRAAIMEAKAQSVALDAYSGARPEHRLLAGIAERLSASLALAEDSLNAAQPLLESAQTINIDSDISITGKILPSAIWLDLGETK